MQKRCPDFSPSLLRTHILNMAKVGNSVHIGCAFSMVEIVSVLYENIMNYDHKNPDNITNDHLVLSKGHGVMALYACFKEVGWIDPVHFEKYFSDGSLLHGLGESKIPGVSVCGGSLGHGLPIASGMALAIKRKKLNQKIYCIVGDGEINEGTIWESLLFISHHNLTNLITIVDANGLQAMGKVHDIMKLEPLGDKFKSFDFNVFECDGHDTVKLSEIFKKCHDSSKPSVIVANTIKGKGVSFMENQNEWHYMRLDDEKYHDALKEINEGGGHA